MKYFKLSLTVFLIICFSLISAQDTKENDINNSKINWMSYDDGLAKAKKENKHIFVDFTTPWCGWCKKMEKEVFIDSTIIHLLNNEIVAIRVDGESKNELDIDGYKITERDLTIKEFKVSGYPTFFWLKPDGSPIGRKSGYLPKEFVIGSLNYVKEYKYDTTLNNQGNKTDEQ